MAPLQDLGYGWVLPFPEAVLPGIVFRPVGARVGVLFRSRRRVAPLPLLPKKVRSCMRQLEEVKYKNLEESTGCVRGVRRWIGVKSRMSPFSPVI